MGKQVFLKLRQSLHRAGHHDDTAACGHRMTLGGVPSLHRKVTSGTDILTQTSSAAAGSSQPRGFTLVELMVVIAVLAIMLTLATPDFSSFIQNNRIRSATEDLLTAINVARTEAIKRGSAILLCRTGDPHAAPAALACGANEPDGTANQVEDWTPGWIMYSKPNYTGSGGTNYNNATDGDPLKVGNPAPTGVTVTSNGTGNQWLTYFGDGTLNEGGAAALFAICDNRGASEGRLITIPTVGRPHVTESPGSCDP